MFPVRAVNQILFEPLCKSVHTCAKFLPIVRSHSAEALRRGGRAAQGWDARGPSGPRPPARLARTEQVGFCGYRVRGEGGPSLPHRRSIETGCPTLGVGGWVLGFLFRSSFPSSLKNVDRKKCGPRSCVIPPTAPRPIPGMLDQSPAYRVTMHVLEFLSYFPSCVYVEIVKPRFPEAARILLRLGKVQAQLSPRWASPLLPHFARHSLLQHLQHRRRRAPPRLTDEQMHMLRHDHVTQKQETVFPADSREFSHK